MLSAFKLARIALVFAATLPVIACEDPFGNLSWTDTPDTTIIFSLSREDLVGLPSAYDFIAHLRREVESPSAIGNWDVAVRSEGGQLALVPAGGFEGQVSRAGLVLMPNAVFEQLSEAPGDTSAYSNAPAIVQPGQVYALRTRRAACSQFQAGVRFGKIKILAVDQLAGTITFESLVNPFCNERDLVPDEED